MKNRVPQIHITSKPARNVLFVEYTDGSFRVFEDDEQALLAYRPKRGEKVSRHRAFVRRAS